MNVQYNLDGAAKMLRKRGLEPNGRVQKQFTILCAKNMDDYVPFRQGLLKNSRAIRADSVLFPGPYAHYQYRGLAMVGIITGSAYAQKGERKRYNGKELNYHGAPMRGKEWDKRMWRERKNKIMADIARVAGGRPG